jgi:hypothetical protein
MSDLERGYSELLRRHGHALQYTALAAARAAHAAGTSAWQFEAAELPVSSNAGSTKIDFVLTTADYQAYLIAECKRANPAYRDWCFARAPFVRRNRDAEFYFVDRFQRPPGGADQPMMHKLYALQEGAAFHVATEVKGKEPGDPSGAERDNIEKAATQVCRGVSGLVRVLTPFSDHIRSGPIFFPVIITTARLWTSSVDLTAADLENGNLAGNSLPLKSEDWIYYQYPRSPDLKSNDDRVAKPLRLAELLDEQYIRTIAIVRASAFARFLAVFTPDAWF